MLSGKFRNILTVILLVLSLTAGAAAPDVLVHDTNGGKHNLNEYIGKGQWTVAVLWAHDCHVCNEEIHEMTFFHSDSKTRDARVLGISVDGLAGREKAAGFIRKHELEFPNVIIEPRQEEIMKLGGGKFVGTPTFYIFSPDGELVARSVGAISGDEIREFIDSQKAARSPAKPAS